MKVRSEPTDARTEGSEGAKRREDMVSLDVGCVIFETGVFLRHG